MAKSPSVEIEVATKRIVARPEVLSHDEINRSWRMAEALASAKVFPSAESTAKAFAVMLVGHDLGLSPTQALMGVHLVEGKPLIGYTLLGGFVKRTPGYDYRIVEHDERICSIDFSIDGETVGRSTFTMEDAKRAGLVKAKSGWEKYPKNMLLARALSNGVRFYMPDVTGGVPVYTDDEIEDRPMLTQGSGSGEAQGIALGPKVEKVLARAAELGHPALADRATAEMSLAHRSPKVAVQWAKDAEAELDDYESEHPLPDEADVVEPVAGNADPAEDATAKREIADQLERDSEAALTDGEADKAEELLAAASEMREQAEALEGGAS